MGSIVKNEARQLYSKITQGYCHSRPLRLFLTLVNWQPSLVRIIWASIALLCHQIRSRNPNEIIFGLNDGYYAADFDQKVQTFCPFSTCIIMEYPVLISLAVFGQCLASVLKRWHVPVPGSVGAEEKQFATGWPEFSQELLQCFLFAQVSVMSCSSITPN